MCFLCARPFLLCLTSCDICLKLASGPIRNLTAVVFTIIPRNLFLSFPLGWPTSAPCTLVIPHISMFEGLCWLWVQAPHTVFIMNQWTLLKLRKFFNELVSGMSASAAWPMPGWFWCKPTKNNNLMVEISGLVCCSAIRVQGLLGCNLIV